MRKHNLLAEFLCVCVLMKNAPAELTWQKKPCVSEEHIVMLLSAYLSYFVNLS